MKTSTKLLIAGLSLLILNPQLRAQTSFAPAVTYSVEPVAQTEPYSVVAADVNGDGKVDLICATWDYPGTLAVFTNDGTGGFVQSVSLAVDTFPSSVVAADVNGDGKVDLICVSERDDILTVFTNDGYGNFGLDNTYTVGNDPECVIAADLNGNGKMDLICADNGDGSLLVMTNDGSGHFVSNATLYVSDDPDVSAGPVSVIAADVNGDGKLDLICVNDADSEGFAFGTLTVFTNDGSGNFALASLIYLNRFPSSVIAADLNGDGKLELICAGEVDGNLSVFTNHGNGGFALSFALRVGSFPTSVMAVDVNGDGKIDLISANAVDGTLSILTNGGGTNFVLSSSPGVGNWPESVIAADVNGDGKPDLICANSESSSLSVFLNTSIFPPPISIPPLTIHPSEKEVLVSWPSVSPGWSLQQNPNLTTSNWSPSGCKGYPIGDDGTNKSLVIAPATGCLFFRLMHP